MDLNEALKYLKSSRDHHMRSAEAYTAIIAAIRGGVEERVHSESLVAAAERIAKVKPLPADLSMEIEVSYIQDALELANNVLAQRQKLAT